MSHPYLDSISASQSNNDFKDRTKICWFWANDGKCNYAAENCKYLHEHIAEGLAPRPAKISLPARDGVEDWASGKLIKVVNVSDLLNLETSPKIDRCEYLASYNWLDYPQYPTILVPGIDSLRDSDYKEES
jgi:hypothetical protein